MGPTNKYLEEHSAKLEDCFLTRRQFLARAGMGFGALSLAALLGENVFGHSTAQAADSLNPLTPKRCCGRWLLAMPWT